MRTLASMMLNQRPAPVVAKHGWRDMTTVVQGELVTVTGADRAQGGEAGHQSNYDN